LSHGFLKKGWKVSPNEINKAKKHKEIMIKRSNEK